MVEIVESKLDANLYLTRVDTHKLLLVRKRLIVSLGYPEGRGKPPQGLFVPGIVG
jgi:hypothetical protein